MRSLFLLLAIPGFGASLDAGYNLMYHLRFAEARQELEQWVHDNPSKAMGPISVAASYLFEVFEKHGVLTTEFFLDDATLLGGIKGTADPSQLNAFHAAVAEARALADKSIKRDAKDADALLALTLAAGMESDAATLIEKKPLDGLLRVRDAEASGKRLLAVAPNVGDAYMALGAASYIVGSLPAYKRAFAWAGGIHGDKARGIQQLEVAATQGHYLRAYAKMMLALASLREKQNERARKLLDELIAEYPRSPLFIRERPKFQKAQ